MRGSKDVSKRDAILNRGLFNTSGALYRPLTLPLSRRGEELEEWRMTMDAPVKKMNALCDALPFQTSWYLKDLKIRPDRGPDGRRARALGEHAEDLDPHGRPQGRARRQAVARPEGDHRGQVPGQRLGHLPAHDAGLLDHLPRRARTDDHRERQHVHGHGGRPGRPRRDTALLRRHRPHAAPCIASAFRRASAPTTRWSR